MHHTGKMIWPTADVPHRLLDNAQMQLQAPCIRLLCSKAENVYQRLFQALFLRTFPRNKPHILHEVTEVQKNGHRGLMLHQCHRQSHQARLLLHKNYVKQRGSPFAETKNQQTQEAYPLILVENFHRVRLAYGDGHSLRHRDQVLATRA